MNLPRIAVNGADVIATPSAYGGKALGLAKLPAGSLAPPKWLALSVDWQREFLSATTHSAEHLADDLVGMTEDEATGYLSTIATQILRGAWPQSLASRLDAILHSHGFSDVPLAVRSSAACEDGDATSFAGIFHSALNVRGAPAVREALQTVWAAAFSARAWRYCQSRGIAFAPVTMGVVIQEMITPEKSGVIFTRSPLAGVSRDEASIAATWGFGEGVVSGTVDSDLYRVHRDGGLIATTIADKRQCFREATAGGLALGDVDENLRQAAVLSRQEIRDLAVLGQTLEEKFGGPLDIEWAKTGDRFFILQARAITSLPRNAVFDAKVMGEHVAVWDNSNIIESFGGVTLPLTFSHTVSSYAEVYAQFCRVMGVPEKTVRDNRDLFSNMLGHVRGRVYYNLLNWYRLVMLFPNADRSSGFMESMMGVKSSITGASEAIQQILGNAYRPGPLKKLWLVAVTIYRYFAMNSLIRRFEGYVNARCDEELTLDLSPLSADDAFARYRCVSRQLMARWAVPIINDMRCMLFFGCYEKLATRWLAGDASAASTLKSREVALFSAEPVRRLERLADDLATNRLAGIDAVGKMEPRAAWATVQRDPALSGLKEELARYLKDFGYRGANELKLEEEPLIDRPHDLISSLRSLLEHRQSSRASLASANVNEDRDGALADQNELSFFRRGLLRFLERNAAAAMADRERLRYLRTKAFAVARRLFRHVGETFATLGVIKEPRDIFYLTVREVEDYIRGQAATLDLCALVSLRRREYGRFVADAFAPDRLTTVGLCGLTFNYPMLWDTPAQPAAADDLKGQSACAGIVDGEAFVACDFNDARKISPGQILITERTDPGWVSLFPLCKALVIERGSLLSHSAVVARELGLPTIVGVAGATRLIQTGDRLVVNATAGIVERRGDI